MRERDKEREMIKGEKMRQRRDERETKRERVEGEK